MCCIHTFSWVFFYFYFYFYDCEIEVFKKPLFFSSFCISRYLTTRNDGRCVPFSHSLFPSAINEKSCFFFLHCFPFSYPEVWVI